MTEKNVDTRWLWWGGVAVFIIGGAFTHFSEDFVLNYPLDTWRVDLDDMIGNLGTLAVGIAALMGIRKANRKIEQNGTKEHEIEKREEADYQELRAEIAELKAAVRLIHGEGGDK